MFSRCIEIDAMLWWPLAKLGCRIEQLLKLCCCEAELHMALPRQPLGKKILFLLNLP